MMGDEETLRRFVLRARRVHAHSIVQDWDELLAARVRPLRRAPRSGRSNDCHAAPPDLHMFSVGLPCFCGHLGEWDEGSAEGRVCHGRAEETPEEVHPSRGYRAWGGPVGDMGLVVWLLGWSLGFGCGEQFRGKGVRTWA